MWYEPKHVYMERHLQAYEYIISLMSVRHKQLTSAFLSTFCTWMQAEMATSTVMVELSSVAYVHVSIETREAQCTARFSVAHSFFLFFRQDAAKTPLNRATIHI